MENYILKYTGKQIDDLLDLVNTMYPDNYYTKEQLETILSTKQEKLTAGIGVVLTPEGLISISDVVSKKSDIYQVVDVNEYPTLEEFLSTTGEEGTTYLYPVDPSEGPTYASGYYSYTYKNDAWISLGTTVVDIANMMTTDTDQTVTGIKTFNNGIDFGAGVKFTKDSSDRANILYNNSVKIKVGANDTLFSNRVTPDNNSSYDLGRSGVFWKDLYLSGALKDGTNSITIADIITKDTTAFRTYTVSEWNNLTAEQKVSAIKKGVIIDGNLSTPGDTLKNPVFLPPTTSTSAGLWGLVITGGSYEVNNLRPYSMSQQYGSISVNTNWKYFNAMGLQINSKSFPTYPTSPSSKQYLTYKTDNTLAWEELSLDGTLNVINASDITSNTLTQAQYDLITNGKPTVVLGSFLGLKNPIFFSGETNGTVTRGLIVGCPTGSTYIYMKAYEISDTTRTATISSSSRIQIVADQLNNTKVSDIENLVTYAKAQGWIS